MPIPNTLIEQVGKTTEYRQDVAVTTETYIGPEDVIATTAASYRAGGSYTPPGTGQKACTITLSRTEKIQSDRAKWTFSYGQDKGSSSSPDTPLSTVWSCVVAQYQFPLEKYLDREEAAKLYDWENKEPDEQKSILDSEAALSPESRATLPGKSFDVAKLKFSGTNEVQRCYPQATRVRTYNNYKKTIAPNLNTTGTEPDTEFNWTGKNAMSWLKVQFDWEQQPDGTWRLTESWQGYPTNDGGWNSNLYDTWEFYHENQPSPTPQSSQNP